MSSGENNTPDTSILGVFDHRFHVKSVSYETLLEKKSQSTRKFHYMYKK